MKETPDYYAELAEEMARTERYEQPEEQEDAVYDRKLPRLVTEDDLTKPKRFFPAHLLERPDSVYRRNGMQRRGWRKIRRPAWKRTFDYLVLLLIGGMILVSIVYLVTQ